MARSFLDAGEQEKAQAALFVELEQPESAAAVLRAINRLIEALEKDAVQRERQIVATEDNTTACNELTQAVKIWAQVNERGTSDIGRSPLED